MLSVVAIGSILIGIITAFMNASGIDTLQEKTIGPATEIAAYVRLHSITALGEIIHFAVICTGGRFAIHIHFSYVDKSIALRNTRCYFGKLGRGWKYVIICKKVSCLTDLLLRVEEIRKENGYEIYQIKNFPAYAVGYSTTFHH